MIDVRIDSVPETLRQKDHWILWKISSRSPGDKPTKLPFQISGGMASTTDPNTWDDFDIVADSYEHTPGWDGVGYVFGEDDGLVGVDLDGCRDPESGKVTDWARAIIVGFNTYAEVSPSGTGVKLFMFGEWGAGRKCNVEFDPVGGKTPGVEVYDRGRYFAVTGVRLRGMPEEPQLRQLQLDAFRKKFFPETVAQPTAVDWNSDDAVVGRARAYLGAYPPAVSGQGGHNTTFRAACVLVIGFDLPQDVAFQLLREWNQTCQPPWSDRELEHKIRSAAKQAGERGYLRNANPRRYDILLGDKSYAPAPEDIQQENERPRSTLRKAETAYFQSLESGGQKFSTLGIPELDYGLGGGPFEGEMIVLAARPSHGKSAVGMQCIHHWCEQGVPSLMISEEMPELLLGKRSVQFHADTPMESWPNEIESVRESVQSQVRGHAECYIVEQCGEVETVIEEIDRHVEEYGVRRVVIDYAQRLRTRRGGKRIDQMAEISIAIRKATTRHKLLSLVLCQMSRDIEKRPRFTPMMSDIKESGQFEQDADVVMFGVWPWLIDSDKPKNEYHFFIAKNRSRETVCPFVKVQFQAHRQRIVGPDVRDLPNYEPAFDNYDPMAHVDINTVFPQQGEI